MHQWQLISFSIICLFQTWACLRVFNQKRWKKIYIQIYNLHNALATAALTLNEAFLFEIFLKQIYALMWRNVTWLIGTVLSHDKILRPSVCCLSILQSIIFRVNTNSFLTHKRLQKDIFSYSLMFFFRIRATFS